MERINSVQAASRPRHQHHWMVNTLLVNCSVTPPTMTPWFTFADAAIQATDVNGP